VDVTGFRTAFPSFGQEMFPDARVQFWLTVGAKRLSAARWGDLLDHGLCLFAAHNLTLEREAAKDASGTGGMGAAKGPVTSESKSVGPVSKSTSYSQATASNPAAAAWNATIYGQQLHDLMQLVGAGGLIA